MGLSGGVTWAPRLEQVNTQQTCGHPGPTAGSCSAFGRNLPDDGEEQDSRLFSKTLGASRRQRHGGRDKGRGEYGHRGFRSVRIRHAGSQVMGDLRREEHEGGGQGDTLPLKEAS